MPALPPVPNTIRATLKFTLSGNVQGGFRHYLTYTSGAPTSAELTTLAGDIEAAWSAQMAKYQASTAALVLVDCQDIGTDSGASGSWTGTAPGTHADAEITAGVCVVFNHAISRRYRGGKPRTYCPIGTVVDHTGESTWTQESMDAWNPSWAAYMAAILASTPGSLVLGNVVNVSYYSGFKSYENPVTGRYRNIPQLREGGPVTDNITSTAAAAKIGSQRRRLNA